MSKDMVTIRISKEKLEQFQGQIGKVRSWLSGWTDAGRLSPPGAEVLWQLDMMLKNREAK